MLLENQVAIVTGATRGIGRAIALALAKEGAALVVNGTKADLLQELAGEIKKQGGKCLVSAGDIADPTTAESFAQTALEEFGRIDILVNNAGMNMRAPTLEMKLEDWRRVLDVNLNGTLYAALAVLPEMIKQKQGRIINISSTTAKTPHKNAAPSYGASKAGVNYLTQHLAFEMAKYNIRVNAVCPGPVETDMTGQWTGEYRERVLSGVPLGRLGTPENVADTVVFLASGMSGFITGETINVNGGTYMN